ncbi:hypothetical protein UFOVP49_138 [uncultured Caudovirales phage]|uniref:Uncharacterized protein n=1 Tax=uncultured Caudovirales phage TaxID=2100421 RepID=A0A6J5KVQ3_9CAUD|nr:hypothetical protein UFOVP49_138 [uncultured Caudovirales phage]
MSKLSKIVKANESFTINRYDNGFVVEVGGLNSENDYKTCKILCGTVEDLYEVINEVLLMEVDS